MLEYSQLAHLGSHYHAEVSEAATLGIPALCWNISCGSVDTKWEQTCDFSLDLYDHCPRSLQREQKGGIGELEELQERV